MARNNNLQDLLKDTADAIREKKGTSDLINPQDFPEEIASISSGGDEDWQPDEDMLWLKQVAELEINENEIAMLYGIYDDTDSISITLPAKTILLMSDRTEYSNTTTSNMDIKHTWSDTNKFYSRVYEGHIIRWYIVKFDSSYYINYNIFANSQTLIRNDTAFYYYSHLLPLIKIFNGSYMLKYFDFVPNNNISSNNLDLSSLFANCYNLKSIPQLNFNELTSFENILNVRSMFSGCYSLEKVDIILNLDLYNGITSSMFFNCYNLKSIRNLYPFKGKEMIAMFSSCYSLKTIPEFDFNEVRTMNGIFTNCYSLKIEEFEILKDNLLNFDASSLFYGCHSIEKIVLKCPNVQTLLDAFENCKALKEVEIISGESLTNLSNIFANCNSLEKVYISNTENVTNMSYMFQNCRSLLYINNMNTQNVTNMSYMFQNCSALKIIPLLNTENVTNMSYMFYECLNLSYIPLLNTENVTNMAYMFQRCNLLKTIPELNTENVTNMNYMFYYCRSIKKIPALNLINLTNATNMISNANAMTEFKAYNIKIALNLSSSTQYSREALVEVLNNLYDLSEQTSQRLTIGNTNLNKLTDEDKAIATNKNWTLA